MTRNPTSYGRVQVAEPHSALASLHIHDGTTTLHEADHEPKMAVLDQEDLLAQGIYTDQIVPGAKRVDALGSCTANAGTVALSNILPADLFAALLYGPNAATYATDPYTDTKAGEEFAITFYHDCSDQTGDPAQEWPPTDCGSSGPYIYSECARKRLASGQRIAHDAESLVSLLQSDGVLQGSPWFMAWEEPDANGFVDGDGSASALEAAIRSGVAGGHETYLCAVEKLVLLPTGKVDQQKTIIRDRNSWNKSWGDHGCCRFHLSTLIWLARYCDWRQLQA